ncbi:DNA transformation protein [Sinobacterium caligoides]|uniref:DNA transformation protein n=1 Tax=Sinobacterium caligoides TaxID=933926 RepID=A0A3N2E211_9GAMM|nr:TfoX/Sxy family protein [Sinobacterium caligoides]ROS06124.1 DNA transformation protein [Sinobacterium caligoides]
MSEQTSLYQLKNLGNTTINWLRAIGIRDIHQLSQVGAVNAYMRIKERGFNVSKVVLYALHGALNDEDWKNLSNSQKKELLQLAESAKTEATD